MQEEDLVVAMRDMFIVILKLGAIPLLTVLAVGLAVSIVQAVTQISEQTLAFVPKLLALVLVLTFSEHFLYSSLADYTHVIFDQLIAVGGR